MFSSKHLYDFFFKTWIILRPCRTRIALGRARQLSSSSSSSIHSLLRHHLPTKNHSPFLSPNIFPSFQISRLYSTEKKDSNSNNNLSNDSKDNGKEEFVAGNKEIKDKIKTEGDGKHEKSNAEETRGEKTTNTGAENTTGAAGEKTDGEKINWDKFTGKEEEEAKQKEQQEEEQKYEKLPPWWPSLPLWKKIFYPTLAISLVSFITELVYQSVLRSTPPYKKAMQVLKRVDEIEEAFGEMKEPKWYQFWEMLYGYWWVQAGGYEGVAKLWIPVVGLREHKTDAVDKNGEPVMRKEYTKGRAYVEAKKRGAGELEWELTYMEVKGEQLGMTTVKDSEWLAAEDKVPIPTKGIMVLVDGRIQSDP